MRLDLAVSRALGVSRRTARDAVRAGRVELEGKVCDEPGCEVPATAAIAFHPGRPARYRVRARVAALLEDDDFVIVDKPAGVLTVPTAERESDTLLARVLDYLHHRYRRRPFAGVVHRLDKDTSGAVVFARNRQALRYFQDLFRRHAIEREYLAIVEGRPPDSGTFDAELVRDRGDRRRGVARGQEEGRRAVTRYRALERLGKATLVSVELETGRTHQVRVHFAAAGHPVVGDRVYRPRDLPFPPPEAPRQMLHARVLGFASPRDGSLVRAESPIPDDFAKVLEALRAKTKAPRKTPGR